MDMVEDKVAEEVQDSASGEALRPGRMWAGAEAVCPAASIPAQLYLLAMRQFQAMQLK
jgi:hypothetical protein